MIYACILSHRRLGGKMKKKRGSKFFILKKGDNWFDIIIDGLVEYPRQQSFQIKLRAIVALFQLANKGESDVYHLSGTLAY